VRRAAGLALALVLRAGALDAAAPPPAALGPCGPVARVHEAVELPFARLGALGGLPLSRFGLLAFRDGALVPIPFQIDERRGRKIILPGGPEPVGDYRPGIADADDVLVFMACDAGEARDPAAVEAALAAHGAVSAWRRIAVHDPLAGTTAAAYLVVADAPPRAAARYTAYTPAGDLVATALYRVGLVNALPTYLSLAPRNTPGPNLLDGLRLRATATLKGNLARWSLHEQQGRHDLIAWREGPVRVIRRSRHHVALGLGINLTAGTAVTYFYPRHVYGPGSMRLPFSPSVLFREISAFGGADGRGLRGWCYHAPGTPPGGFRIDGRMDRAERAFDGDGDWFLLERGDQALLFVLRTSESLARHVTLRLVYRDDAARADPPEAEPGQVPLVGWRGEHVERVPGGRYEFALRILALDAYRPGDEARLLAALDAPLAATVTAEDGASVPAAPAGARRAPR
jgi:hypothetical protein